MKKDYYHDNSVPLAYLSGTSYTNQDFIKRFKEVSKTLKEKYPKGLTILGYRINITLNSTRFVVDYTIFNIPDVHITLL